MGKKGFIEGILHDILLSGIIEASRDESGKADPYKAAGIAYGMGHSSAEDHIRLATMLGADGAFDTDKKVADFSRSMGKNFTNDIHVDWREDISLENDFGIDPYDYDSEEDYLDAVSEAKDSTLLEEDAEVEKDAFSFIPITVESNNCEVEEKERSIKEYLHTKYSDVYPKIFTQNYVGQSFYEIGCKAAKSPSTVDIPFKFLIEICSQFDVSGINIFNLLVAGSSKKYINACNEYAKELMEVIRHCSFITEDYESILGFIYSKYMLSSCSLDKVCDYISTIVKKIDGSAFNEYFFDFIDDCLEILSDGLSDPSYEEKNRFLALCKNSIIGIEQSVKYKKAYTRVTLENEMEQLFWRFFSNAKKIYFDFEDEAESIDELVFSMITGKEKKKVYPLFSELLINPSLTVNQKRWMKIGFEYLALYAAEGYCEDEMYEYFKVDNTFRKSLLSVKYIGIVLGNMLVISIRKNDMATYRDILCMYKQFLLHNHKQNSDFIKQINESIECVYIDPFCNTAEKFAEYIEFRDDLLSISQQEKSNKSYPHIKRYCNDIDLSYGKYKNRLEKISLTEAKYKELLSQINRVRKLVKEGKYWKYSKSHFCLKYTFKYPNGKHGDINKYLASRCGSILQIDPLHYYVEITDEYREFLPLLCVEYDDKSQNMGILRYLNKEHNFFILKQLLVDIEKLQSDSPHDIRTCLEHSDSLWNDIKKTEQMFYGSIQNQREQIYQTLAQAGLLSSKWVSEYQVFKIVSSVYPDAIYQYHAEWLGSQSLDVFIPSINAGIEYQGIQHYKAIDIFGGEESFKDRKRLDAKKKRLCKEHGISLIEVKYTENITVESIIEKLEQIKN